MINTSNGHIHLPSFELTPELDINQLLNHYGTELNIEDMQTGWKWVTVNNVQMPEQTFNFRLGFFNDHLTQLSFTFNTTESVNWDAWSRTAELKKLELFRTWLNTELGEHRTFNWGTVSEVFDEKAGFSSITVNYSEN